MRVAVVAHVFYPELWDELAVCIRNASPCDVVVTYVDEAAVRKARHDFPGARFVLCENRGYDIWPFLLALKTLDLSRYDLVVKLHTKRDIVRPQRLSMNGVRLDGTVWRDLLLSFAKTPEAWRRTLERFADPRIGMVAACRLVYGRNQGGTTCFDRAVRELGERFALPAGRHGHFVGGTMFAVRAELLAPFAAATWPPETFAVSGSHDPTTYAHVMERMLGLAVGARGYRIEGFDGSVARWRAWQCVSRFFFDSRHSRRRRSIRICKITVYLRRLAD